MISYPGNRDSGRRVVTYQRKQETDFSAMSQSVSDCFDAGKVKREKRGNEERKKRRKEEKRRKR